MSPTPYLTRRVVLAGMARVLTAEPIRLGRKLRIVILGLDGHMEEILGPLDRLPDVEVVGIADQDVAAVRSLVAVNNLVSAHIYVDQNHAG